MSSKNQDIRPTWRKMRVQAPSITHLVTQLLLPAAWRARDPLRKEQQHMRADMGKAIIERERGSSSGKNRKWGARLTFRPDCDYEDEPKHVPSGRGHQPGGGKWFRDMLTPLEGFLRKSVGRPWSKVHSEACEVLDARSITGHHALDHLKGMVKVDAFLGDRGEVLSWTWGRVDKARGFYVHPRTGLLLWAPEESAAERKRKRVLRKRLDGFWIDNTQAYRLIEGIWYVVTHKRVSVPWLYSRPMPSLREVWDVAARAKVRLERGDNWVAIEKRQCNRAELATVRELVSRWEGILHRPKLEIDPKLRVILTE